MRFFKTHVLRMLNIFLCSGTKTLNSEKLEGPVEISEILVTL